MPIAVVVEALRTPRGAARESGALHGVSPMELLAQALRALQQRTGVDTGQVADGVFGCVTQTGEQGGNIGKSACLLAGWSPHVGAVTINRFCASGLSAVNWAAQQARALAARKAGLAVSDIDLWEVRDSFAAITLHYIRSLGIDLERFNLETAVGRARVGRHGVCWQGVTTRLASASKEEQRGQRDPGRLNRVRSAITREVSVFVAKNVSVHRTCQRKSSGQLPFLGSMSTAAPSRSAIRWAPLARCW